MPVLEQLHGALTHMRPTREGAFPTTKTSVDHQDNKRMKTSLLYHIGNTFKLSVEFSSADILETFD
jgi:hypothetical protein